jgi:hypothetical protein
MSNLFSILAGAGAKWVRFAEVELVAMKGDTYEKWVRSVFLGWVRSFRSGMAGRKGCAPPRV